MSQRASTGGETASGLHQGPWGTAASQPRPAAAGTAGPVAARGHSEATHTARGLAGATARADKNCLNEDKDEISQAVQK